MIWAELKKLNIRLRKEKQPLASFSSFLLAEVAKVGKNAGDRETTEDEAIQVLKKLLATAKELGNSAEAELISGFLPQMVSDDVVRIELCAMFPPGSAPSKSAAMKGIREKFGARVDMKRVSELYGEVVGQT